ncbi:hypothetical protein RM555_04060 [Micromonospora sp. DSM 115977]|uniref:Uncharacterized protein n=1 Tax=Micromonospora reichwaldensis TaxID=3075516 RepID=A0ABU2WQI4_9ACTN|nr:hypothetical protein [Micromonospora sp. DSM 115977]MDT0528167.1 hypothetical protein [Micromonospora sp. DSM 115977]
MAAVSPPHADLPSQVTAASRAIVIDSRALDRSGPVLVASRRWGG